MRLLLCIFLFAQVHTYAQKVVLQSDLTKNPNDQLQYLYNGEPFSGKGLVKGQDPSLSLKKGAYKKEYTQEIYYYEKGYLTRHVIANPNKKITRDAYYKNGKLHGDYIERYTGLTGNVTTKVKGKMVNGKKEGNWRYYHRNGVTSASGNYENDVEVGIWKYQYKDGSTNYTGEVKNMSPQQKQKTKEAFLFPLYLLK